jgi:NAD-dependent SIR2 family protein deacetylase
MMILQDLIASIANRDAVFFCGAGISRGLEDERGFPGGWELARDMAENLLGRTVRDDESLDLKQIAQEIIWGDNGRRNRLNEYLLKVFADPTFKPLRAHKALVDLECNVITTNYDTLIEDAFKQAGKRCGTVVRENDLTRMRDVNVVKIHGCVTDVDNIVIAEEDYCRWLISDSEMKTFVRQWFIRQPIVFIGFSLSDPNFRQLYYDLRLRFGEALKVAHAVFKEKSDNYDTRFIEKQGITIIEQDATVFLEDLVGQVVFPQAFDKYGPMACARKWRKWLEADPAKRTPKDLEKLVGKSHSHSRFSDILNLTKLPALYQELVDNQTIDYMPATYIRRLRTVLEKRGELEKSDEEIYKWARTGPSLGEAKKRYEQLKAGKSWSELEHK